MNPCSTDWVTVTCEPLKHETFSARNKSSPDIYLHFIPWERGKKANCFITETFTSYFTLTGASDAAARLWEKLPSTPASELKRISQPWKVECRVRNPDLWTLTFTERQMYQQKKRGHKTVSKSIKHLSVFESTIVLLCQGWLLRKLVCSKGLSWLFSNSRLWSCCSPSLVGR